MLLEVDRGRTIASIAREFSMSRTTIHHWISRFRAHEQFRISKVLADRPGRGRKSKWTAEMEQFVVEALTDSPWNEGYQAIVWTVPLLKVHLDRKFGIKFSDDSIRLKLHKLGYAWKRPRYKLTPDPGRGKKNRISVTFSTEKSNER